MSAAYLNFVELEHHATFRSDVAVIHVSGLFQTEDYARALSAYMNPELATFLHLLLGRHPSLRRFRRRVQGTPRALGVTRGAP
ncbi:Scr1 family TA system antitoxin-like transcriptional regulator [Streptomyces prasinus]|uniref:Scr1 family TA system antitoxin-like transcriptional regulator n=1 Tax=Streptomyces prasinus TaxID=67345 RepID=UPI003B97100F